MNYKKLTNDLLLFHQFLKKNLVSEKLTNNMNKFPEFIKVYSTILSENREMDTSEIVANTLVSGIKEGIITNSDLDELLFLLLEDSLFNSFLFNFESNTEIKNTPIETLLKSWNVPSANEILRNVNYNTISDFVICGYRTALDGNKIESIRILLLDSDVLSYGNKNQDLKEAVYPTLVEFDFRRKLLHIRLRDVDNIVGVPESRGTMSGRIDNTLKFLSSLKPVINFTKISNFKSTLYTLEEHLLSEKRNAAYNKLEEFDTEVEQFTQNVCDKFNPSPDLTITPKEYINTGVLCIVATTLEPNELGDVIGIRFRDSLSKEGKYAEITIKDSGDKCISTSNLYWLNLSVLQSTKKVEFLKIITHVPSGVAVANLEFILETANIRLIQKSKQEGAKPTQEKYDDVLDFLKKFL